MTKQLVLKHLDWGDFVDLAAKTPKGGRGSSQSGSNDFAGCSLSDALRMARTDGYREAIPEADRFSHAVSDSIITERLATTFEPVWEVSGAEVDMGRYVAGIPENMIEATPMRIAKRGRAVRIAVPVCYACTTEADVILRRGAAVMALVDVLARAQHPLEVWAGCNIHGYERGTSGRVRGSWMVKVQEANAPLDMGRIMYALAHPSMLRRLFFAIEEHESASVRATFGISEYGGYGSPTYETVEADLPDQASNTIILPELASGDRWEAAYCVKWITRTLAQIFGETD